MHLAHLRLRDFRNYPRLDADFSPGFHLLLGNNAQGKTNILEAIYLLATLRSFRGVGGAQLVRHGAKGYFVGASVQGVSPHEIKMYWSLAERKLALDGQAVRRLTDYLGTLRAVVFCTEDLQLVKGAARARRRHEGHERTAEGGEPEGEPGDERVAREVQPGAGDRRRHDRGSGAREEPLGEVPSGRTDRAARSPQRPRHGVGKEGREERAAADRGEDRAERAQREVAEDAAAQEGDVERGEWADYLRDTFRTMPWAPVAFVTAKNGRNVKAVVDTAQRLYRQSHERVPTAKLNTVVREAVEANHPPADGRGRPVRIYYATQVETAPPTIVLSTSAPKSVSESYKRYLVGALRKSTPFREVPIRLYVRGRTTEQKDE